MSFYQHTNSRVHVGLVMCLAAAAGCGGAPLEPAVEHAAQTAVFSNLNRLVVDHAGNILASDQSYDGSLVKIKSNCTISRQSIVPAAGWGGDEILDMVVGSDGTVYADTFSSIVKVSTSGTSTFLVGQQGLYPPQYKDGAASVARLSWAYPMAIDSANNLYVVDWLNDTTPFERKITPAGVVSSVKNIYGDFIPDQMLIAGGTTFSLLQPESAILNGFTNWFAPGSYLVAGYPSNGFKDGAGSVAEFNEPNDFVANSSGSIIYVADTGNHVIRKITTQSAVTTFAGKAGQRGGTDGTGSAARFDSPRAVALDTSGNLFVIDGVDASTPEWGTRIRKITPAGVVTSIAGNFGAGVVPDTACSAPCVCGTNATCNDVPGARACNCNSGYAGDPLTLCTDIDECQTNNGGCDMNATCTNTVGSYTCACKPGYSGDGVTCTDINECLTNNGGCDAHATCTNTPGSRTCSCNLPYAGDGLHCEPLIEATAVKPISNGSVEVDFKGQPNLTYAVQGSDDLSTWSNLDPVMVANATGNFTFIDTRAKFHSARFYRAKLVCSTFKTCDNGACGSQDDGCGGQESCGCDDPGLSCHEGACSCLTAKSCDNVACGQVDNGCGGQMNCGCNDPIWDTCQAGQCVCIFKTDAQLCAELGACGTVAVSPALNCNWPRTITCGC